VRDEQCRIKTFGGRRRARRTVPNQDFRGAPPCETNSLGAPPDEQCRGAAVRDEQFGGAAVRTNSAESRFSGGGGVRDEQCRIKIFGGRRGGSNSAESRFRASPSETNSAESSFFGAPPSETNSAESRFRGTRSGRTVPNQDFRGGGVRDEQCRIKIFGGGVKGRRWRRRGRVEQCGMKTFGGGGVRDEECRIKIFGRRCSA
jgi:hypothetical protein